MALVSLVYVSVAAQPMSDDELRDILAVSRENNGKLGITGMLLYRDRFFIQALEGEQAAVDELFDKIAADERHENVLKVYETPIEARSFGEWRMGFNKMDDITDEDLPGFMDFMADLSDLEFFTGTPSRATTLLDAFKHRVYF